MAAVLQLAGKFSCSCADETSASDMPRKDKEPSAYQFKSSLQYDNTRPKFLQNALAALAGGSGSGAAPTRAADGREPIPQRPDGDEYSDPASDEGDEWGFSRDDEAPTVVVLKEGKHVDRDEYDRLRAEHGAFTLLKPNPAAHTRVL